MATKRIYQIAKEFECDEKKIIEFLTGQGIKVANRLSAVSEDTYNLLKTKLFAPPPPPPPEPEPEPAPPPKVEEPAQVEQPAAVETTVAPVQGGGKKKKKKKKKPQQFDDAQGEDDESQEEEIAPPVNFEAVHAATQVVCGSALVASNEFLKNYIPPKKRKINQEDPRLKLSRTMDEWGLLQYLSFDSPDSSPIRYWQAVNKLTTAAYKVVREYGLQNRKILAEMREVVKSVGAKYEPQEIFTDEENQKFEAQQKFLFNAFGHGMGAINDNLYDLKMYATRKKAACEHINFVDYLTNPDSVLETKIPIPFDVLVETVNYSIRSIPCHVTFYLDNKDQIIRSIENFFAWIDGYKKLKEQGADAAKLEKYLELEDKFFQLVEFMSFDNLLYLHKKRDPIPFDVALSLLNEYRDNMDDPDAERQFKYKVRGITNVLYKAKEYVFLFKFAGLEPNKEYRTPEEVAAYAAAKAAKAAAEQAAAEQAAAEQATAEQTTEEQENPAEKSDEA